MFTDRDYQLIEEARELITPRRKWTHGQLHCLRPTGMAYCAMGALHHVAGHREGEELADKMIELHLPLISINDGEGHRATLAAFDRVLEPYRASREDALAAEREYAERVERERQKAQADRRIERRERRAAAVGAIRDGLRDYADAVLPGPLVIPAIEALDLRPEPTYVPPQWSREVDVEPTIA